MKEFNAFKKLLVNNGVKQREAAKALNVSDGTISLWCSRKAGPPPHTWAKIAEIFGVSVDYFAQSNITLSQDYVSKMHELEDRVTALENKLNERDIHEI